MLGEVRLTLLSLALFAVTVPPVLGAEGVIVDLAEDGGPASFAAAEIRREAAARGLSAIDGAAPTRGDATRISLAIGAPPGAASAPQAYAIRVRRDGGAAVIRVIGTDAVGLMYGGLDIAEAIRTGTLDGV